MSWMAKLYETYEQGMQTETMGEEKLMPVSHTLQNAHINIVLDGAGCFKRAVTLEKTQVVLPATEKSAGRSCNDAPHALADKLQYVAADYERFGGMKEKYFESYHAQLSEWCESECAHPKAQAVLRYVEKRSVIQDLVSEGICHVDEAGVLLTNWSSADQPPPPLLKILPKVKGRLDQGGALVCWTVETEGDLTPETWKDHSMCQSWITYQTQNFAQPALCYISGKEQSVATNHPKRIRHTGDQAKLLSANDQRGFTFRGRFVNDEQAANISFEVTQKAHNALRWLIARQGVRNGDQVMVAWAVSGRPVPEALSATYEFDLDDYGEVEAVDFDPLRTETDHGKDFGQRFASALKRYLSGYYAKLDPTESIIIMALDSATPGRMAITYYRDFMARDYLKNVELWHWQFAWYQRVPKNDGKNGKRLTHWLISAPPLRNIFQAAYGDTGSDILKKKLYERLLPTISEGRAMPVDLVSLAVSRASNRNNKEPWEWEQNLGVTCALYRGFHLRHPNQNKRRDYAMALETDYASRDYLYGRLLAIAERIEEMAMIVASEPSRSTHASRLMQRFADRPASTWLNIEKALVPYQQRLRTKRPALEKGYKELLDNICNAFDIGDFNSEARLSGEYLLGFHCQRKWLRDHRLSGGQWVLKTADETESTTQEGSEL